MIVNGEVTSRSPLAVLLKHAIDLIDGGVVPEKSARELALELDTTDLGAEGFAPNVRIGLNYLKGRMQNLEDDLGKARAYAVDLNEKLAQERRDHQQTQWRLRQAERDLATYTDIKEDLDDD